MGLEPLIKSFLEDQLGFPRMMPVQKTVIPLFMKNYDVAVESCTGSGKTLAFLVPIFQKYLEKQRKEEMTSIFALIITPTRELAIQIYEITERVCGFLNANGIKCKCSLLIGGAKGMKSEEEEEEEGS